MVSVMIPLDKLEEWVDILEQLAEEEDWWDQETVDWAQALAENMIKDIEEILGPG